MRELHVKSSTKFHLQINTPFMYVYSRSFGVSADEELNIELQIYYQYATLAPRMYSSMCRNSTLSPSFSAKATVLSAFKQASSTSSTSLRCFPPLGVAPLGKLQGRVETVRGLRWRGGGRGGRGAVGCEGSGARGEAIADGVWSS